jgi:hypothetical protein
MNASEHDPEDCPSGPGILLNEGCVPCAARILAGKSLAEVEEWFQTGRVDRDPYEGYVWAWASSPARDPETTRGSAPVNDRVREFGRAIAEIWGLDREAFIPGGPNDGHPLALPDWAATAIAERGKVVHDAPPAAMLYAWAMAQEPSKTVEPDKIMHDGPVPDPAVPVWTLERAEAVPIGRWGKDHWQVFLYVDDCWVNSSGFLDADKMRTDVTRHPVLFGSGRRAKLGAQPQGGGRYPTRLKSEQPREDGTWGAVELAGHDDWDCLDDIILAGLVEVRMPVPDRERDRYLDARGRAVTDQEGEVMPVGPLSGLMEDWLMTRAAFHLTDAGQRVAGRLRAHRGQGRNLHQFHTDPKTIQEAGTP